MDPIMPTLVGGVAALLLLGLLLQAARQPQAVAYLLAGVLLGPAGLGVVTDQELIARLGELGVILLLFFLGTEISLPAMLKQWRVSVVGTAMQVALSVGLVAGVGAWLDWSFARIVLLGFALSLSSTAVALNLLRARGEMEEPVGRDVVGVLLMQDLAIVPMMIVVATLGGEDVSAGQLALQIAGGAAAIAGLAVVARRGEFRLPFEALLTRDEELRVFAAGLLCFGMALVTGLLGLSTALGAFVAGVLIGASRDSRWVHESLYPFHVLFLAVFFVSVGMLIDLDFLREHWRTVALLVVVALVANTVVNMVTLRVLGRSWANSLYGGAILSQIGEFSFVLAAVGLHARIIAPFGYKMIVIVIALTLLVSPFWIALGRRARRSIAATETA